MVPSRDPCEGGRAPNAKLQLSSKNERHQGEMTSCCEVFIQKFGTYASRLEAVNLVSVSSVDQRPHSSMHGAQDVP